jgi:hypothetical protein
VKARNVVFAAAAAAGAVAGLVWWRRRSSRTPEPVVQLGLDDGSVQMLDRSDPLTIELETLAAGVRDTLTGGA